MESSEKDQDNKKTKKQPLSVRERAEKAIEDASKSKKPEKVTEAKPVEVKKRKFLKTKKSDGKEKKPKRFHIVPKFIRSAFAEIKLVSWPDAKTTTKLTTAVIIFASVFAIMVSLVDSAFGRIFKKVFLHG